MRGRIAFTGVNHRAIQFLYIVRGSLSELDTQLDLGTRLAFLNQRDRSQLDG
ncbi:MAG: four helix bundle protein [Nitrospinae bacterium]|nr:four helix bundle protein [Nitrospinota bacterium]